MDKKIILMVDDVKLNHVVARDVLSDTYELYEAYTVDEGYEILKKVTPDLILLDLVMPGVSGMEMLDQLKATPAYKNIPVILLTANTNAETEVEGFNHGIVDYITKPFVAPVMKKRIETQIKLSEYEKALEEKVQQKVMEMEQMYDLITVSFAGLVESRDGVTGGHLKNTSIYFSVFIEYLETLPEYKNFLTPEIVKKACRSAPLHDVGKIAIKDAVLQKPARLSDEEFEEMRGHAIIGGEIFDYLEERIPDKDLAKVAGEMARSHHEKWDGTGYPDGLKGEEIPLVARIMSVADVYDALTSKRPYKEAFSHEKAIEMISAGAGSQFDPELIKHFLEISDKIKACLITKEEMTQERYFFRPFKEK